MTKDEATNRKADKNNGLVGRTINKLILGTRRKITFHLQTNNFENLKGYPLVPNGPQNKLGEHWGAYHERKVGPPGFNKN